MVQFVENAYHYLFCVPSLAFLIYSKVQPLIFCMDNPWCPMVQRMVGPGCAGRHYGIPFIPWGKRDAMDSLDIAVLGDTMDNPCCLLSHGTSDGI